MHDFSELEALEPEDKLKKKHLGTWYVNTE